MAVGSGAVDESVLLRLIGRHLSVDGLSARGTRSCPIAALERQHAHLRSQFASIGEMRSGSLTERSRRGRVRAFPCARPNRAAPGQAARRFGQNPRGQARGRLDGPTPSPRDRHPDARPGLSLLHRRHRDGRQTRYRPRTLPLRPARLPRSTHKSDVHPGRPLPSCNLPGRNWRRRNQFAASFDSGAHVGERAGGSSVSTRISAKVPERADRARHVNCRRHRVREYTRAAHTVARGPTLRQRDVACHPEVGQRRAATRTLPAATPIVEIERFTNAIGDLPEADNAL